jgi:hypothetical protein
VGSASSIRTVGHTRPDRRVDDPLIYSTYLGGNEGDAGNGIAVDKAGNAYVTGWTFSTNFPTINPLQTANGGATDVFVAKIQVGGADTVYSFSTVSVIVLCTVRPG